MLCPASLSVLSKACPHWLSFSETRCWHCAEAGVCLDVLEVHRSKSYVDFAA